VFITDGHADVSNKFLEVFNMGKKVANFQVIGVVIDYIQDDSVRKFSDKVIHVNGGEDEEALDIMFKV
jgi:uncharacterized protein with von Willebrand factor type A (vWA) domain